MGFPGAKITVSNGNLLREITAFAVDRKSVV